MLVLGRRRQEGHTFEASLGYTLGLSLKKKKQNKQNEMKTSVQESVSVRFLFGDVPRPSSPGVKHVELELSAYSCR